jgi:hypothetical protein
MQAENVHSSHFCALNALNEKSKISMRKNIWADALESSKIYLGSLNSVEIVIIGPYLITTTMLSSA